MGLKSIYEKNWKRLMIIPIVFLIFSIFILGSNYASTGDFIEKDISLKGGYLLTIEGSVKLDLKSTEESLSEFMNEQVKMRKLSSLGSGGVVGYSFEYAGDDIDGLIDEAGQIVGTTDRERMSIEEISSAISERFWNGTIRAILVAIAAMAGVVFLYFRKLVPAIGIVISGISNIIGTFAIMSLLGISISASGIAAILMLLGYSIDSNIVLTARALKRKELSVKDRIYSAIKTGLTMSITSIVALTVLYIASPAAILKTISLILIIGLLLDLMFTWIQNAGILRIYLRRSEK
jgi:preprotein translocase subunit SecF